MAAAPSWRLRTRVLTLDRPRLMGIVNVTPDSFSDGGRWLDPEAAVARARALLAAGADIIDVGGESTRPGALPVAPEEEARRVLPVIETLACEGAVVSLDSSRPEVMRAALAAGAEILNDVRAFRLPGALELAAGSGAGLVVCHMQGEPRDMQRDPRYRDLLAEVRDFLLARDRALTAAGADPARICLDVGFGFGKSEADNFTLLAHLADFVALGRPFLAALSRKSFIGAASGVAEPGRRVAGSVAAALACLERGARLLRVHDVAATREAIGVWSRLRRAAP